MRLPYLVTFLSFLEIASASNNSHSYFGGAQRDTYLEWYGTIGKSLYNASTFVSDASDSTRGAAVHWSIHNEHIALAVVVRASGWLGFGLSENGGMRGSDLFLFETAQPDRVRDAHVLDELVPVTDCQQDWILQAWNPGDEKENPDFLIVQVTRALNTGDSQDRPIVTATDLPLTRIIVAWGDTPEAQYHGSNRVRGAVQWVQDEMQDFATRMKQESAQTFRVGAMNYTIPAQETEYADFCLNATDMVRQGAPGDQPISIIGVEPMIDQAQYVHHLTMYGFTDASCGSMERSLVYAWGPGDEPMMLPSNVALYAGSGHSMSFLLEIHYDNVNLVPDVRDSTVVQFHYTTAMRPVEADILQLGDPLVRLSGTEVGTGDHTFSCPSSCTSLILTEPVTVLREYLHMHAHGAQAQNEVLRNGEVVHRASVNFFDFNQQGNQAMQQHPYQVEPGDAFRTTCRYQSGGDEKVRFGKASQEEICIAFILYYPRQKFTGLPWACAYDIPFGVCSSAWEPNSSNETVPRTFGTTNSTECNVSNRTANSVPTLSTQVSEATSTRGHVTCCSILMGIMMMATLTSMVS